MKKFKIQEHIDKLMLYEMKNKYRWGLRT